MPGTPMSDALIAAYRNTNFRVLSADPPFVFRIGERSDALARLFARTSRNEASFITAENPFSQTCTAEENAANQARLNRDLAAAGAILLEGAGQGNDPGWPAEASYLAIGISREQACEFGRKYRQNAIVWIGPDAVPELVFLR